MKRLLYICAFFFLASTSFADDLEDFTKSKPPKFVYVQNVRVDLDLFKVVASVEKIVPTTVEIDEVNDGKPQKTKTTVNKLFVEYPQRDMAISRIVVKNNEGKTVANDKLPLLIGKIAILSADENEIDPMYLRLFGKDVPVITLKLEK